MSINKIVLSFTLTALIVSGVMAETSGGFIGIQGGYSGFDFKLKQGGVEDSGNGGARYGIVLGSKNFYSPRFGLRFYTVIDYGDSTIKKEVEDFEYKFKYNTLNINANIDILYNLMSNFYDDYLGVFVGLSGGWAYHKDDRLSWTFDDMVSGADVGINFGFRANIAKNHGLELYSRFGIGGQEKVYINLGAPNMTEELSQPYAVGLRYTFFF